MANEMTHKFDIGAVVYYRAKDRMLSTGSRHVYDYRADDWA